MVKEKKSAGNTKIYIWIMSFTKRYQFTFLLFIICQLVNALVHLSVFKFLQYFIDYVLPDQNLTLFTYLVVGLSFSICIMFISTVFGNSLQRTIQEKTSRDLQFRVFNHLRNLGLPYFENKPLGQLFSMFNSDVASIQKIYREYLPIMIKTGTILILSIISLIMINLRLVLVAIPVLGIYYSVNPFLQRKAESLGRITSKSRVDSESNIYDSVSAIPELRSFGAETWGLKRIMETRKTFNIGYYNELKLNYLRSSINISLLFFGLVLLFIYGTFLLKSNYITIGQLVASLFFYFQAITNCTSFVNAFNKQRMVLYQAKNLYNFCDIKPSITEKENTQWLSNVQGEINFNSVYFKYIDKEVLSGLNLHIPAGNKVALVGESGGGKSTILKLIGRLYDPDKGEVTLDNVPLTDLPINQVRDMVGYVFQETYLFGGTICENIKFGYPEATDEQIIEAAKAAFIHNYITELPDGYNTVIGERGIKLSGGQKQRISIARLFLKNPKIVILDEATASLDNISEYEIKLALNNLFKDRTIIAVAHRISTIKDYDQIFVVEGGNVLEHGTYEMLLSNNGKFSMLDECWQETYKEGVMGK